MTEQPDALETVLDAARQADAEAAATMREVRAEGLTFADAVRIREAAAVLEIALPRILTYERDVEDRSVKDMARALDVTESYVHRLIRQHRAAEAAPSVGEYGLSTTGGHEWHRETPTAGRRCRRCDLPHSQWSGERCTGSNDQ
ncbi:hypothetical protein ABZ368_19250 [Streptomyces sp. NPDC005908]|uniref:hypothetical protein n=1 Tax=Streptomyces sp. NPDC005908 TaxID=3157084 RepID=UPI0033FB9EF1